MDLVDQILATGDVVLFGHDSYDFKILTGELAGQNFSAHGQQNGEVNIPMFLAEDSREKAVIYVQRPAPDLKRQDRIAGKGSQWLVVHRNENPMTTTTEFVIVRLGANDS